MKRPGRSWAHAVRVAGVAALVVVGFYAVCAIGLSMFVGHRLTGQVDGRLQSRLATVGPDTLKSALAPPPIDSDGDLDDVPIFLWKVHADGPAIPLTAGAPGLPGVTWSTSPSTVTIGRTPFRIDAVRVGSNWVVAGSSVSSIARTRSTLVVPEVGFGVLVALVTFAGALIVGLRASAPIEVVRRRQAEFTADASHELRTPISVIQAEVDLALRRPRTMEQYRDVLRRIGGEGQRLRRIVEDLLWLARVDTQREMDAGQSPLDVAAAAGACVQRFSALASERGAQLSYLPDVGCADVVIAPEWIDRLAGVLIDNALKFAGNEGSVEVRVLSSPSRVALQVDDSGPGIPPAEREAIFDRFHRASSEVSGTGLGLAIADSIVRLSGGTWTVGDADLGGARIQVVWRRRSERASRPVPHQGDVDHSRPATHKEFTPRS
jgi:signal transduction histidine kinase